MHSYAPNVIAAQFERRLIGQRTKDALAVKRSQGLDWEGQRQWGLAWLRGFNANARVDGRSGRSPTS
jgi:DNA invertase Pin-like site-specific DNA recombinase